MLFTRECSFAMEQDRKRRKLLKLQSDVSIITEMLFNQKIDVETAILMVKKTYETI